MRLPSALAPIHLTRTQIASVALLLLLPMVGIASPVAVKNTKEVQTKGVEVTVTPEMTGAGMVSTGAKLPPYPPGHR